MTDEKGISDSNKEFRDMAALPGWLRVLAPPPGRQRIGV
jgi:hypothetical protein